MDQIKFENIKPQLQQVINQRLQQGIISIPGEADLSLMEGFFTQPIQAEATNITIGGPAVPMVALVGNTSGRMYFFALKALLPDLIL